MPQDLKSRLLLTSEKVDVSNNYFGMQLGWDSERIRKTPPATSVDIEHLRSASNRTVRGWRYLRIYIQVGRIIKSNMGVDSLTHINMPNLLGLQTHLPFLGKVAIYLNNSNHIELVQIPIFASIFLCRSFSLASFFFFCALLSFLLIYAVSSRWGSGFICQRNI